MYSLFKNYDDKKQRVVMKKINKQTIFYLFLIILTSLSVTKFFILQNAAMIDNDVDFHYARALSTVHAWRDHQIIPQLDPTGASNLGFSWNLFYGPLPTYFIALLYSLTHNLALSVNSITVLIVCLIGVIMYKYIYYRTKSEKSALIASIILITSTTILNNLYQFTGYGPLFGTFFAILTLYGIQIILDQEKNIRGIIFLSIGAAGVLLSHTLTCIILIFYIFWVLLANVKNVLKKLKSFLLAAILSFGLSAYFILPFLEVKTYQLYNQFNKEFTAVYMWKNPESMNNGRSAFKNIFFSRLSVSSSPSILFWLSLVLCIIIIFIKVKPMTNKKSAIIFFIFATSTLALCGDWIDWHHMPSMFWTLQYPNRIMYYASGLLFSISIGLSISVILEKFKKEKLKFLLTIALSLFFIFIANASINSSNNVFHRETVDLEKIDPSSAIVFKGDGGSFVKTSIGEFFPSAIGTKEKPLKEIIKENKGAFYLNLQYIYPAIENRKLEGSIFLNTDEKVSKDSVTDVPSRSDYKVKVKKSDINRLMEIPKVAYPGYKARIVSSSGKVSKLDVGPSSNGYVQVLIPKNASGEVTVYYGLSKATLAGLVLFVISFAMIIILLVIKYRD